MSQQPSIAIIGAGPAGLTAANVLHRHHWRCKVFEADASASARDQGGTLDLHAGEGQRALETAGLLEQFIAMARHEDQGQRLIEPITGKVIREFHPTPGEGNRPEIDRTELRDLLLNSLPRETVDWNSQVRSVKKKSDGSISIQMADGRIENFELVIGADGTWSKVRKALSSQLPSYTGITFIELWLEDIDRTHPALAELVGHGTMFSLDGSAGIIAQRNGNAKVRVYAALRLDADISLPSSQIRIGKPELLSRFVGWSPSITALLEAANQIAAIRPIMTFPAEFNWPHQSGITLVGDAAHVMPPLGAGVNLSMLDAAELAEEIVLAKDWRDALESAERNMRIRSRPIAQACIESFQEMFSKGALQSTIKHFDAVHQVNHQ